MRIMLWPRRSWSRSAQYVAKRVLRLTASPHAISAGVAAGVFASFTPFIGFHFVIAFLVAYLIAGNFIAAASGTFFGNPVSFPFIWAGTHKFGSLILGNPLDPEHTDKAEQLMASSFRQDGISGVFSHLAGIWEPLIKPMLVGAVPLGVMFGIAAYVVTRTAAVAFRKARMKRIARKSGAMGEEPRS